MSVETKGPLMTRKPHHPPLPGPFNPPENDLPDYIRGDAAVAGFGCRSFYVATIARRTACEIIIAHHYSRRIVNNSYVHLGVWIDGTLVGVLQFGYALNPARMGKIVAGSSSTDYLELNRMWLSDVAPRNSESRAIAYAVRYIRAALPHVSWLQSFADERCGGWGVVYQAANFLYVGCHSTTFFELDGETFHEMLLTVRPDKAGSRGAHLRANVARATKARYKQFRYVFFIRKSWRRRLRLPIFPYPKRQNERSRDGGLETATTVAQELA